MPDRFAKWNADPLTREIFNPSYRAAGAYNAFRPKSWRMVDKFVPYETVETEPVPRSADSATRTAPQGGRSRRTSTTHVESTPTSPGASCTASGRLRKP